jgi:hypothetical protein
MDKKQVDTVRQLINPIFKDHDTEKDSARVDTRRGVA